jgi:hypothetical protein
MKNNKKNEIKRNSVVKFFFTTAVDGKTTIPIFTPQAVLVFS